VGGTRCFADQERGAASVAPRSARRDDCPKVWNVPRQRPTRPIGQGCIDPGKTRDGAWIVEACPKRAHHLRRPHSLVVMVGVPGLEPGASASQRLRATNCATPRVGHPKVPPRQRTGSPHCDWFECFTNPGFRPFTVRREGAFLGVHPFPPRFRRLLHHS
jgi:hypothetical protein